MLQSMRDLATPTLAGLEANCINNLYDDKDNNHLIVVNLQGVRVIIRDNRFMDRHRDD